MGTGSWFLIIPGVVLLLVVMLAALAFYGYRRLAISVRSVRVFPEFQVNPASIVGGLVNLLTRNFVSAAGGFIKGIKVSGQLTCFNRSRLPLYLPATEHEVLIEGTPCPGIIRIGAFWLKAGASRTFPVRIHLGKDSIPQVALVGLTRRGGVNIEICSRAKLGPFSYRRRTRFTQGISRFTAESRRAGRPARGQELPDGPRTRA